MDVGNLLRKASDDLSVRRAFGAAYEKDDMLIIPVAIVASGGGGGTSLPRRGDPAAGPDSLPEGGLAGHDATVQDAERMDAGGGFGGLVGADPLFSGSGRPRLSQTMPPPPPGH
jgi:hypothetical protein